MEKKALPFLMFLLIYGPKIAGFIDTLSIFCILVFFWSIVRDKTFAVPSYIARPTVNYLLFALVMLTYGAFLYALNGLKDTYQIFRFGRVIVNVLGVLGLTRIYYSYYKHNLGRVLLFHLWLCIIAHASIIVLMFLAPPVNEFVITQLVQLDEANRSFEARIQGNRIGGLTGSWDAASGIQALGILLLPFVFGSVVKNKTNVRLIYLTIPLSLSAIFLSGVTGLVIIGVVCFIFVLFYYKSIKTYVLKLAGLLIVIAALSGVVINYMMEHHSDSIVETSIGRTLFMITQNEELSESSKRGSTAIETIDKIGSEMYFLPDDDEVLFFGRGGSGRVDYIIKADTGPTLNLHNLGIFFVLILYSYCVYMVMKALKSARHDLYMAMGISAVVLTILIIDVKVAYLLSRQSLSIMLIAYFSLFWLIGNNKKRRESQ